MAAESFSPPQALRGLSPVLAGALDRLRDAEPLVVALPRGGVPVGFEVAKALTAPLDIVLVRKLGAPFNPEYALKERGAARVVLVVCLA